MHTPTVPGKWLSWPAHGGALAVEPSVRLRSRCSCLSAPQGHGEGWPGGRLGVGNAVHNAVRGAGQERCVRGRRSSTARHGKRMGKIYYTCRLPMWQPNSMSTGKSRGRVAVPPSAGGRASAATSPRSGGAPSAQTHSCRIRCYWIRVRVKLHRMQQGIGVPE